MNNNIWIKEEESDVLATTAYNMAIESFCSANTYTSSIQYEKNQFLLSVKPNPNYGLPFGNPAKLLLNVIVSEIKLTKSPVLRLGKIYSNLLHISQLAQVVSIRNKNHFLYDQMLRMFSSKISFSSQIENNNKKFDFWWNPLRGRKENISASSTIVVTRELFIGLLHSTRFGMEITNA
jgi:hypothetical protein